MNMRKRCKLLLEGDSYFNGKDVNTNEFNKHSTIKAYCRNDDCKTNEERINALTAYIFKEYKGKTSRRTKYNDYDECFLMWLSDKLYKMHIESIGQKYENNYMDGTTLNEAYEKYLKNYKVKLDYWILFDMIKDLKEANLKYMSEFYKLLNKICKIITDYNNSAQTKQLSKYSVDSRRQYRTLHMNIYECKSYLNLLNKLKGIYDDFSSAIKKTGSNNELATKLKKFTLEDGTEMAAVRGFKTYNISNTKCKSLHKKMPKPKKAVKSSLQSSSKKESLPLKQDTSEPALPSPQPETQQSSSTTPPEDPPKKPELPSSSLQESQKPGKNDQNKPKDSGKETGGSKSEIKDPEVGKGNLNGGDKELGTPSGEEGSQVKGGDRANSGSGGADTEKGGPEGGSTDKVSETVDTGNGKGASKGGTGDGTGGEKIDKGSPGSGTRDTNNVQGGVPGGQISNGNQGSANTSQQGSEGSDGKGGKNSQPGGSSSRTGNPGAESTDKDSGDNTEGKENLQIDKGITKDNSMKQPEDLNTPGGPVDNSPKDKGSTDNTMEHQQNDSLGSNPKEKPQDSPKETPPIQEPETKEIERQPSEPEPPKLAISQSEHPKESQREASQPSASKTELKNAQRASDIQPKGPSIEQKDSDGDTEHQKCPQSDSKGHDQTSVTNKRGSDDGPASESGGSNYGAKGIDCDPPNTGGVQGDKRGSVGGSEDTGKSPLNTGDGHDDNGRSGGGSGSEQGSQEGSGGSDNGQGVKYSEGGGIGGGGGGTGGGGGGAGSKGGGAGSEGRGTGSEGGGTDGDQGGNDGGQGGNGGGQGGNPGSGEQGSNSDGSNDSWPSLFKFVFNGIDKFNKASNFVNEHQQKFKDAKDKINNAFNEVKDNFKIFYDQSINHFSEFINNITDQFNQDNNPSKSDNSDNNGPQNSDKSQQSGDSPQPQPKDTSQDSPSQLSSNSPSTSLSPPSSPPSSPPPPTPPSGPPKGPSPNTPQPKQPASQSQPTTQQNPQDDPSNQKKTDTPNLQLVKSSSSDPNLKKTWSIIPTTWNGSEDCKPEITFMNTTLVCCTSKQCSITGIPIILVLIPIILLIVCKYLSSEWRKEMTRKKNMTKVINVVGVNKTTKMVINSSDGKKQVQIIIKSSSKKKKTKKSINSVYGEKSPSLNIYQLMQADPVPFINLIFLLIFFVYKRKRDFIEL
ncbi:CIR protein [Plasmodium chabaudi chabaudi]|uniref:CIR protein n=1 Tax=Plasmodium chabaudi chabaudi TaxID=31271 RepID=A0A4V0K6R0_PLACU|nr:CIR protein [Plasmodium chabaudi chabaudi]VTZ68601.1 CIR protein [Plasmodium chabaudi chabaudi]|eukprot:XP_016652878.1 CIR protein [Plasmodium chabaudi chabaudi]